jgi:hypothetical protein
VGSLFLFRRLVLARLRPAAAMIALGMFAVSDDLIAFSAELKQYETDVALGLVCTLMGLDLAEGAVSWRRRLGAAALGAGVVWFSHASVFVLAGVGTVLMASSLRRRDWTGALGLALIGLSWASSITAVHMVAMDQLGHTDHMWIFWNFAFPPMPPASFWDATWVPRRLFYFFVNPLDFYRPLDPRLSALPALGFFGVGVASLWGRDRTLLALLAAPLGFTLLAACLHLYPFHGRLVLFLVPSFLIVIAEGSWRVGERFDRRAVWVAVLASILLFPTLTAVYHLGSPRYREDFNPHGDRRPARLEPVPFPF